MSPIAAILHLARGVATAAAMAVCMAPGVASAAYYFETDFESGLPSEITGVGNVEGTQGYGAYGFGQQFLRSAAASNQPITLILTGLPAHAALSLDFFLAIIDSWDGNDLGQTHPVVPDYLNITVDGTPIFSETFENSSNGGLATTQSYVPPSGVTLARYADLGFGGGTPPYWVDSAYDMGLDTQFDSIAHTASTLTIQWFANGAGWQGQEPGDESFAIDNLKITLLDQFGNAVPEPTTTALFLGLAAMLPFMNRRRRPVG